MIKKIILLFFILNYLILWVYAETIPVITFQQTSSQDVSNSLNELSLLGTGVGTKTIKANSLKVGQSIEIIVCGFFNTTLTPKVTIEVKIGSVIAATTGLITLVGGNQLAAYYEIKSTMVVLAIGTSGYVSAEGIFSYTDGSSNGKAVAWQMSNIFNIVFNTTIDNDLDVGLKWNTASTANSMVSIQSKIIQSK